MAGRAGTSPRLRSTTSACGHLVVGFGIGYSLMHARVDVAKSVGARAAVVDSVDQAAPQADGPLQVQGGTRIVQLSQVTRRAGSA